ncbi:MAG: hypothetical protein O3B24_08510 [Verrucomicrobia bacterium]|nr:hypothetical protein [Verrucomicrobiota bacterium]
MILAFDNVHSDAAPDAEHGITETSFVLRPGELLVLRVDGGAVRFPLADLACGILAPQQGVVRFQDEDWQTMPPTRAATLRGAIGRVFHTGAWLSNLDVDENVTLSQRYHTSRPESEIIAEARELARRCGLADLPATRPPAVNRKDLQRAQWVRALLGQPRLIVLEFPIPDANAHDLALLAGAVAEARQNGAAALWITSTPAEWQHAALNTALNFEMKGTKMLPVNTAAQDPANRHG